MEDNTDFLEDKNQGSACKWHTTIKNIIQVKKQLKLGDLHNEKIAKSWPKNINIDRGLNSCIERIGDIECLV